MLNISWVPWQLWEVLGVFVGSYPTFESNCHDQKQKKTKRESTGRFQKFDEICKVKLGIGIACLFGDYDLHFFLSSQSRLTKPLKFLSLEAGSKRAVFLFGMQVREHEDTKVVKKKTRCLEAMKNWQFFFHPCWDGEKVSWELKGCN